MYFRFDPTSAAVVGCHPKFLTLTPICSQLESWLQWNFDAYFRLTTCKRDPIECLAHIDRYQVLRLLGSGAIHTYN